MAKEKVIYYCQSCGAESSKWMGQCPACKEWNTLVEEVVSSKKGARSVNRQEIKAKVTKLKDIETTKEERIRTKIGELDRVLGGGIVSGSMILVGGDPGIGKSTLLLQVCKHLADDGRKILYVSGEESLQQIKIRAERIGKFTDSLSLLCETNLDIIGEIVKREMPEMVVIDSIQTM